MREGRWPLQLTLALSTAPPDAVDDLGDGVLAADVFSPEFHVVVLNENTTNRAHTLARSDHAAWPPGTFVPAQRTSYGLLMHEMGHATVRAAYGMGGDDLIVSEVRNAGFEMQHIAGISTYAASSPQEFFAEAYAQRNMPEGWSVFADPVRERLELFAESFNRLGVQVI